jgi:hypothetical protein
MSLAIADARAWVRDYARNASDQTEYPNARIDRAIQYIGTEFVKFARCTRQTNTITLAASTAGFSTTGTGFATFRPEYLIGDPKCWITVSSAFRAEVEVVSMERVFERQKCYPSRTSDYQSCPSPVVAFLRNDAGTSGAIIEPAPDAAATYVFNFMWDPPFTSWTLGGTPSPDSFNIPDEYMIPLLTLYVPRALQHNEPEHIYSADRDAEFMAYCQRCAGSGGLGVTSIRREAVSFRRERGWW